VCCFCFLVGIVLIVAQPPLYSFAYNATRTVDVLAPPPEVHRLLEAAKWQDAADMRGMQTPDGLVPDSHLHDLIVTVRYLAKRALASR